MMQMDLHGSPLIQCYTFMLNLTGPVYAEHRRQCCDNSVMTLVILVLLKSMQLLQNGLQPHSEATPLLSMTKGSLSVIPELSQP